MSSSKLNLIFLGIIFFLSSDMIVCSQGRPLTAAAAQQRHLLSSSSSSAPHSGDVEEAAAGGGKGTTAMTQGTLSPDTAESGGGSVGIVEDARPTAPGHSPGAGHAFTNKNGVGRRLLAVTI